MSDAFEIRFPREDVRAFFRQMETNRKALNLSAGRALRQAANQLGRACGASTKVPTRDVKAKKRTMEPVGKASRTGNRQFRVTSWKSGERKRFTVTARNVSEAKKLPQVKVGNFGLAKRVWAAIAREFGRAGSDGGATKNAKRLGQKFGSVKAVLKGDDPYVRMTNSLPYAVDALQQGERSIDTAMARATRALAHSMEKQLERKMKAGIR
jgi:hypothetical protein